MSDIDLTDSQLQRYSRQILLPQVDYEGQQRLLAARVLVVGAGGLGSPVCTYLAGAGVGHITVADGDVVDLSNLHRQTLHLTADVGRAKAESACAQMRAINPDVQASAVTRRLEGDALRAAVAAADVVLDCCDNFPTRFAVNDACLAERRPLVSGAAVRLEGQVSVYRLDRDDSPCYRCLYPEEGENAEPCSTTGVLGPVVGVIGALQALEAIKLLAGFGESLAGRLLLFDARGSEWQTLRLRRDPACPACGTGASA